MVVHDFVTCHGGSCFYMVVHVFSNVMVVHVFSTCHGGSCFYMSWWFMSFYMSWWFMFIFTCHGGSCLLTYVLVVKGLGGWVSDKVGVKGCNVLFLLVFFWQGWQRHRWWQSSSSSDPQKG